MKEKLYPTVTSVMWHPTPELKERWIKKYGKDRFTFEEAIEAQSFPKTWIFPPTKTKKWKWLAEAFPPKVSEYLFNKYISKNKLTLLDLFAGIGGWSLGAVWSKKFKKIIMVEIDKEKCRYLESNFSNLDIDFEIINADVREIDTIKADVIVASPPCEDLSVLRHFSKNKINRGTIPLTVYTMEYVNKTKPIVAFYENVYRKPLIEILKKYGWITCRFDMSKIIPQKRVRIIGIFKKEKGKGI